MSKPIRVLHIIGKMDHAGAETLIMTIYRRINRQKIQFDFLVNDQQKGDFDDEIRSLGGRIFYIPKFLGFNWISYRIAFKNFLKKHPEYRVIHGHIGSSALIYLSVAKSLGRQTIIHSHSAFPQSFNLHDHLIGWLNRPSKRIASVILAASKQAAIDRFGQSVIKQRNFAVLNNAIDTSRFLYDNKQRREIRQQLGIDKNTLVIGNVGRLVKRKNQKRLIYIFKRLLTKKPNAQLLILGAGPLQQELVDLIDELKITSQVHLVGMKRNVAAYLSAMDVFVFPSINEGLGISLIEAQCSGLPCLAANVIPGEAKVSSLLTFESLDNSDTAWVRHILRADEKARSEERYSHVEDIRQANYDINQVVPWISRLYLNLFGGKYEFAHHHHANL